MPRYHTKIGKGFVKENGNVLKMMLSLFFLFVFVIVVRQFIFELAECVFKESAAFAISIG